MVTKAQSGAAAGKTWLRLTAAAGVLGVSEHTLRRWADAGRVPCRRSPGGQRRFRRADLERLMPSTKPSSPRAHPLASLDRRITSLLESSRAIATAPSLEEALRIVARRSAEALDSPECLIWEYDRSIDALIPRAYFEKDPSEWDKLGVPFPLADHPIERAVLERGEPLEERLSDPALDPASRAALMAWGDQMCLTVPLRFGDEANGLLVVFERAAERRFTSDEIAFAGGLAELAAAAIHNAQLLRRQEEQTKRLASLLDASRAMASTLVLDEVLDTVARKTVEALHSQYCVIWEYLEQDDAIFERAAYEVGDTYQPMGDLVRLSERPTERRILESHEPVIETISDPDLDPGSRESMEKWGEKTCLSVPLRFGREPLGLLVVGESQRERHFTQEELELTSGLAEQAAVAMHNARLYQDLQRRNEELAQRAQRETDHARRLTSLLDAGRAITSTLVLEDVLDIVARKAAEALACPECIIFDYDRDGDTLTARSLHQVHPTGYDQLNVPFPVSESPGDRRLLEDCQIVADTLSDADLDPEVRASMQEWGEKTCLNVPLHFGGEPLGILVLIETERERAFTPAEIELAGALSEYAALAIHNARVYENVKSLHLGNLKALSSALA